MYSFRVLKHICINYQVFLLFAMDFKIEAIYFHMKPFNCNKKISDSTLRKFATWQCACIYSDLIITTYKTARFPKNCCCFQLHMTVHADTRTVIITHKYVNPQLNFSGMYVRTYICVFSPNPATSPWRWMQHGPPNRWYPDDLYLKYLNIVFQFEN